MEEQKTSTTASQEEKTNARRIYEAIKKHKKEYYKSLSVAFVIGCILVSGTPNYYDARVELVPETGSGPSGTIASLASSFGINMGGSGSEALAPSLYPDFMESVAFATSLFDIKVRKDSDDRVMTYYEYLSYEQKQPWWSSLTKTCLGWFGLNKSEKRKPLGKVNPFRLTSEQEEMMRTVLSKIKCDNDKRSDIITIKVRDQDPLVAATVADSVRARLEKAIIEYRTKKARHDLEYIEGLYKDASKKYERISEVYAEFMDANQNVTLQTVLLRQTKLENEMQLLYNNYNTISSQLLAAKSKVQEKTPVFTTLKNATVPLGNTGPLRKRTVMLFVLFTFLFHSLWVLYKEDELKLLVGFNKRKS